MIAFQIKKSSFYLLPALLLLCISCDVGPSDFLNSPGMISSQQTFGHLGTVSVTVSATTDIFLAKAPNGTEILFKEQNQKDTAPLNSPLAVLKGMIQGGETIEFFATGEARHEPFPSINFDPNGWELSIDAGPANNIEKCSGAIGSLVGLFNNQKTPFVIGRRKQITVPRGAKVLYLGVLDFPGASANNQGEYVVTMDVIRR